MSKYSLGPLFIVASERSGTNLLRRRISENQSVYIGPPPTHILKHLFVREPYYGCLTRDENFKRLILDSIGLAYNHFSPWDYEITLRDVLQSYEQISGEDRSVIGVMHTLYTLYAKGKGFESYICKDNNLFDFVYPIALTIPEAKFLFLHRDPRDFVVSQLGRPSQVKGIAYLSLLWKEEQEKLVQAMSSPLLKDRSHTLSYETFIKQEENNIANILCFLNVSKSSSCAVDFESEAVNIHEWKNLNKPTMTENSNKFLTKLNSRSIRIIEAVVGQQMSILGYKRAEKPITIKPWMILVLARISVLTHSIKSRITGLKLTDSEKKRSRYVKSLRAKTNGF